MARGLLGGMTDYSNQSLADIITDLQSEQRNVAAFIEKIEQNLKTLVDNGFWKTKVISNFQLKVAYSIKHYKTARQELGEIATEIQIEVKEHHCKRLQKLSDVAQEINVDIGKIWHQDYEEHGVKDYDDPNFRIVEDIYADTRDMAVNLLDMANIVERLKDYIGKQNLSATNGKKKFKLEFIHWFTIISATCGLIVLLFGNNIWGRFHTQQASSSSAFYVISIASVKTESQAKAKSLELKNSGSPSGYLWIPDYSSLSGVQLYSVYVGPFSTQHDCEIATEEYRKKHPEAYGVLVSHDRKRVQINGIGKVNVTQK